jgi:hypothetical protein
VPATVSVPCVALARGLSPFVFGRNNGNIFLRARTVATVHG